MKYWQLPILIVLIASVVVLSILVVSNRHEARRLFVELQQLEKERDQLTAKWSRLTLEEGSLLNQVRVEQHARQNMRMRPPRQYEIRIITE